LRALAEREAIVGDDDVNMLARVVLILLPVVEGYVAWEKEPRNARNERGIPLPMATEAIAKLRALR
jgi:hypothetical protein